jgi:bifunctional N-acetylglucosamine-1-phosphate-uridyltransferase/glucosamine-1-phosphate-acetyltransferase GlmU-like protein
MKNIAVILAGGMGKRMKKEIPKVIIDFDNIPILVRILREVLKTNIDKIFLVVGKYKSQIETVLTKYQLNDKVEYIIQKETLGTGHAVLCCRNELLKYKQSKVLILYGDTPLISANTISNMLNIKSDVVCMVAKRENPYGCGRIIEENGIFKKIVEEKDCNETEKAIKKVNSGIYTFNNDLLCKYLPYLKNNNKQNEYYLTDMIEIIIKHEQKVIDMYELPKNETYQTCGVNTLDELNSLLEVWKSIKSKRISHEDS